MSHQRKRLVRCCEPGCSGERYCLGRCNAHFRKIDPVEAARLRNLTRAEREAEFDSMRVHPPMPKWEYEGDQDALAAVVEKQEQDKSQEQNNG